MSSEGFKSIEGAVKKAVEAPKSIIDEGVGLVGDAVQDIVGAGSDVVDTVLGDVDNVVQSGVALVSRTAKKPFDSVGGRAKNIGRRMQTSRIE